MSKREKGITLVSLVVTIIILIILAGVSIHLTLGENGMITMAKKAKENIELSQIEEQEKLNELYAQMETEGSLGETDTKNNANNSFLWSEGYLYYYGKKSNNVEEWVAETSGNGIVDKNANEINLSSPTSTSSTASVTTKNKIDITKFNKISVNYSIMIPHYGWSFSIQISEDKENWIDVIKSSATGTSTSGQYTNTTNVVQELVTEEPVYIRVLLNIAGSNGNTGVKLYSIGFMTDSIIDDDNHSFLWNAEHIYFYGRNNYKIGNLITESTNEARATKYANYLCLYSTQSSASTASVTTKDKIDLTKYNKMSISYSQMLPHYGWSLSFQISTDKENWIDVIKSSATGTSTSGQYGSITNVTNNITTNEPVYVRAFLNINGSNGNTGIKIYSIEFKATEPVE